MARASLLCTLYLFFSRKAALTSLQYVAVAELYHTSGFLKLHTLARRECLKHRIGPCVTSPGLVAKNAMLVKVLSFCLAKQLAVLHCFTHVLTNDPKPRTRCVRSLRIVWHSTRWLCASPEDNLTHIAKMIQNVAASFLLRSFRGAASFSLQTERYG